MFSSFKLCAKYNISHTIPCEFWLKVRPGLGVNWCKTCLGCNEKKKRESQPGLGLKIHLNALNATINNQFYY